MLDTKADGEGLGLEMDASSLQHTQRVARAVSRRQNYMATAQSVAVLERQSFHPTLLD